MLLNFFLFYAGLEIVAKDPISNETSIGNQKDSTAPLSGTTEVPAKLENGNAHTIEALQPLSSQAAPSYKEKLYTETIQLMTEGVFSLPQLCKVVSILSGFQEYLEFCKLANNLQFFLQEVSKLFLYYFLGEEEH